MRRVFILRTTPYAPGATGPRMAGGDATNHIRRVFAQAAEFASPSRDRHREVKAVRRRRMPNRGDLCVAKTDCRASLVRWRGLTPLAMTELVGLVLLILVGTVSAQTVTRLRGLVFDQDDSRPIAHATVTLARTAYATITDEDGRFSFDHLPEGWYTVEAKAVGYSLGVSNPVRVTEDATARCDLGLTPTFDYVGAIVVRGEPSAPSVDTPLVISRHEIEDRHPRDLADLLATVPGVQIQRTGTACEASVAIRGSLSRQVLVLVDGQQINSSATGEADLNSVPLAAVERVEVHKGGSSAQYGPNALGGVINIITRARSSGRPGSVEVAKQTGRWKSDAHSVALVNPVASGPIGGSFTYDRQSANGDFAYDYSVQPSGERYLGTRANNDSYRRTFHLATEYVPNNHTEVRLTGQRYDSERGIPGRANNQNLTARSEDDRTLLNSSWKQRWSERVRTETSVGFSRYRQDYLDTGKAGSADVGSEYVNDIWSVTAASEIHSWAGQTITGGMQAQSERLTHRGIQGTDQSNGRNKRADIGLYSSVKQDVALPLTSGRVRLGIEGAIRWDEIHTGVVDSATTRTGVWSPLAGATLTFRHGLAATFHASYGKSVSLPTLNALFWKGDARAEGNPGLNPERSEHSEAGIELSAKGGPVSLSGGMTYFHTYTHDLVQWQPDFRGIWKPYNLAGAQITGHEDELTLGLFDRVLEIEYRNTITTALNREPGLNSYGKQLRYTPHYQTALAARVDFHGFLAAYSARWAGRRYTKVGNESWYDPYRIDDLRLEAHRRIKMIQCEIEYQTYNLRNETYTLIAHYPMPPREWRCGLTLTYAFGSGEHSTENDQPK